MKTFFFTLITCVLSLMSFISCNDDKNEDQIISMTVASEMRTGKLYWMDIEMDCYLIKEDNSKDWKLLDPRVLDGFNYESGYEYILEIKKTYVQHPAQDDGPEFIYQFIKIISKIKKNSFE